MIRRDLRWCLGGIVSWWNDIGDDDGRLREYCVCEKDHTMTRLEEQWLVILAHDEDIDPRYLALGLVLLLQLDDLRAYTVDITQQ